MPVQTTRRRSLALLASAPWLGHRALAQTPPTRLVVPYPAGGVTDQVARAVAERLGPALGQTLVVENRPGAGSRLGVQAVIQAPPDGRTLLFTNSSYSILPIVDPSARIDPLKDLQAVGASGRYGLFMAVGLHLPVRTLAELIQRARQPGAPLTYGSSGLGSGTHFAGEYFQALTGTELTHVPYKSTAAALNDVAGGQLDLTLDATAHTLARAGKVRVLATTGSQRSPLMPEVPTAVQAGLPGYAMDSWVGLLAPAATPAPVLARLRQALVACQADPGLRQRLQALGLSPESGEAAALQRDLQDEARLYRRIAHDSRMQFD